MNVFVVVVVVVVVWESVDGYDWLTMQGGEGTLSL